MKGLLYLLDPPEKDKIEERISSEKVVIQYWFKLSVSLIILMLTVVVMIVSINKGNIKPAVTYEVNVEAKIKPKKIITLRYPQESANNRRAWVTEAVMSVYSFDFLNVDSRLRRAKYYFKDDSYNSFMTALKNTKLVERIKLDKLEVSLVPLMDPVFISRRVRGENTILHYRVPVLISYYGGVNVVSEKKQVEIRVVRGPLHKNPKGFEILSFAITGARR